LQCEPRLGGGCNDEHKTGNETGKYIKEWTVAVLAKTETSSYEVFAETLTLHRVERL
jgi:hypothetical protein